MRVFKVIVAVVVAISAFAVGVGSIVSAIANARALRELLRWTRKYETVVDKMMHDVLD